VYVRQKRLSRRESQELTRTRLLEAAEKLFVRCGFDAAAVEQIAEEAGYSRGAFYSNFASKDEIFLALLERKRAETKSALDAILRTKQDAGERFRAARDWYTGHGRERNWTLLKGEFNRVEIEGYAALVAQYFAEAGTRPTGDPQALALALLAAAEGLNTLSFLASDEETEKTFTESRQLIFDRLLGSNSRGNE